MSNTFSNFINGQLTSPLDNTYFDVTNPATGEVFAQAPQSSASDVDIAVQAAKAAQTAWAETPSQERGRLMFQAAQLLREHSDELIELMVQETGKAIRTECRPEVMGFPETFEFFGGLALELKGETVPFDPNMLTYTIREPLGVVAAILPWNVPLLLMGLKVPPALVTGNTVVVKSAEQSPLITLRAIEIINKVLPAGVLNVIHGDGPTTGAALVAHIDVNKVSFTGSVEAGRHVNISAASRLVPTTLELGGKGPMIICKDADLEATVEGAINAMRFTRQGQSCSAASRIFVHESLHDVFLEKYIAKIKTLKMGDPTDESTDIGAIISQEQLEKVQSYTQAGKDSYAKAHICGQAPSDSHLKNGFWHPPVVFSGVQNSEKVAQEEIFGPVSCILKWNDFDQVLKDANDTPYGLTATVWTNNLQKALKATKMLQAGMVQVNQSLVVKPGLSYGGTKNSGLGKEASLEAMLEAFTEKKTVIMKLD